MKYFDLVIFDLDGTLIDSKKDLAEAVNATRRHLKLEPLPEQLIASYVGDGAPMLIRRALGDGFSEEELAQALEYFINYYHDHCLDYTRPYPGIPETLKGLKQGSVKLAVLTNKPVRISKHILEGLGLLSFFDQVYGGNSFEHKKPHPAGVHKLIQETAVSPNRTLIVGDSSVDVETARNAGVRVCGVTYGLKPETFEEAPPDYLVDEPQQILEIVFGPQELHQQLAEKSKARK